MKSTEIQTELTALAQRRTELSTELEPAQTELKPLRKKTIFQPRGSSAAVIQQTTACSSLEALIAELDEIVAAQTTALEAAQKAETRAAAIETLRPLVAKRAEYDATIPKAAMLLLSEFWSGIRGIHNEVQNAWRNDFEIGQLLASGLELTDEEIGEFKPTELTQGAWSLSKLQIEIEVATQRLEVAPRSVYTHVEGVLDPVAALFFLNGLHRFVHASEESKAWRLPASTPGNAE